MLKDLVGGLIKVFFIFYTGVVKQVVILCPTATFKVDISCVCIDTCK